MLKNRVVLALGSHNPRNLNSLACIHTAVPNYTKHDI
jgi:hypothetical protein